MATTAFVNVFAGAAAGAPVRDGRRVDEVVAWMAGVPMSTGLLLLRRGETVLGSADALRTMRELLDGVELR